MKNIPITLCFILFVQFTFSQEAQQIDYLVQNVSVVPMNEETVLQGKDIAIKDGKIVAIVGTNTKQFLAEKTINAEGKFALPTLADAHVHLPEQKGLEKYFVLNLINGVTKLRSMRGKWEHFKWMQTYDSLHVVMPKVYLSPQPFYRSFDLSKEQMTNYIKTAKKYGFSHLKMMSVKNEALFKELNRICEMNDMPIAAHFPKNLSDSLIFHSQINDLEHLGGLIDIEESLLKSRIEAIKANGVFICPTLNYYVMVYGQYSVDYMKNQRGMEFIAPKKTEKWANGTIKYRNEVGEKAFQAGKEKYAKELDERYAVLNRLNEAGVKLLISPDASSKWIVPGFSLLDEMKLYKKAGLSNYDILKAATVNFADYFNDENYGTIEVGKNADFILLKKNPLKNLEALKNIEGIFFDNQFLNKASLKTMAAKIRPQGK